MNAGDGLPNHSGRMLAGALAVAVVINLALLLLIGSLVSGRDIQRISTPSPQPIDFIRIAPKAEEPEPPEPKPTVEAAPEPASERPVKPPARKPPERPRRPSAEKKPQIDKTPSPGVPAPRIDIPEQGTGAPLAPGQGADPRLTAPPSRWDVEKQPETGDSRDISGDAAGVSGGQNLVVLHRVQPRYPSIAEARGIEGWVRIEITVTPAGTVSDARVLEASPEGVFDRAALEAIRQWRFKPAFRDGRAAEQQAVQTVRFQLQKPR